MATYQSKFDIGDQVLYFGVPVTVVHDHGGNEYTIRTESGAVYSSPVKADRLVLVKQAKFRPGDILETPNGQRIRVLSSVPDGWTIEGIDGDVVKPWTGAVAVLVERPGVQVVARASTFRRELEKQLDGFASAGHLSPGWRTALPPDAVIKVAIDHCERVAEQGSITGSVSPAEVNDLAFKARNALRKLAKTTPFRGDGIALPEPVMTKSDPWAQAVRDLKVEGSLNLATMTDKPGSCTECGGKGFVELFTSSAACSRGCGGAR